MKRATHILPLGSIDKLLLLPEGFHPTCCELELLLSIIDPHRRDKMISSSDDDRGAGFNSPTNF
jgi:hypothetical protein